MQAQSAPPVFRPKTWWPAALIFGLALVCYWPALHGGLVWDDEAHVTRPDLQSAAGLWRIWSDPRATQQYYPVLHSAFWIEHKWWGDATLGYHLLNVLLHASAAWLLVLILRHLKVPGAALAGLIFVVHPVCVESVAWISEQKNTLSLVFYLLAARAYLRFDEGRGQPGAMGAYLLASLLFGLALLTKTVTATLPAALLVIFWWQRGRLSWRRDVGPLIPWFAAAIASGLITAWVERKLIGAEGADFDLTLVQRGLLAGRVIWFYLGKLLWPVHLIFIYPHWDVSSAAAGWAGYLAAAAAVTAALWLRRGRGRGALAAWLFFVGSLFPALGFFNVYPFIFSYVADHFQYLASLGVITAASAGAMALVARASWPIRAVGWTGGAVLIAIFAGLSRAESRAYKDMPTLYETTLARNPDCWMAHSNLGIWYSDHGDAARAVAEQEAALRAKPDYAQAHYNLGDAWLNMPGKLNDAIAQYQAALRLKPDYPEARNNLGGAWLNVPGRLNDAIAQLNEALRLKPDYAEAHYNLGNAWSAMPGRKNDAIVQYREALRLKPNYAEARNGLGKAWSDLPGRTDDAIAQFQEALRLNPNFAEAHNNLGNVWSNLPGRMNDAIAQYQQALRLKPDFAEAHNNLGNAWSDMPDRVNDAIAQFREALRLKPDFAGVHNNLGIALNAAGRPGEAVAEYEEALRLMPANDAIHFNLAIALLNLPGRTNEAVTQLETFLRAEPGNQTARQILAQIRAAPP